MRVIYCSIEEHFCCYVREFMMPMQKRIFSI